MDHPEGVGDCPPNGHHRFAGVVNGRTGASCGSEDLNSKPAFTFDGDRGRLRILRFIVQLLLQPVRRDARLYRPRATVLPIFNALQHEPALSTRTKSLTCHGWQILFRSSCSIWSCSAASIVEPLHRRPIAVGKSAAHLVCRPAALVACPCDPVQKIAKFQSAKVLERGQ